MARYCLLLLLDSSCSRDVGPVVLGSTFCTWSLSSIYPFTILLLFPHSSSVIVELLDVSIMYHRCSCSGGDRCPCVALIFVGSVVEKYGRDRYG